VSPIQLLSVKVPVHKELWLTALYFHPTIFVWALWSFAHSLSCFPLDFYVMFIRPLKVPLLVQFHLQYYLLLLLYGNMFFKLFASKIKFPIFRFTIAIVWNNYVALFACITSTTTSSTDFGVLVYVIGFLDPSIKDPSYCTNTIRNHVHTNPCICDLCPY
jgi:hypothetical protein